MSPKISGKSLWPQGPSVLSSTLYWSHVCLLQVQELFKKYNTLLILETYMSLDSIVQKGHWKFALSHHHTIWILLHGAHLLLELLKRGLLDHASVC